MFMSAREALDLMEEQRFDVVVSDMRMPVMDGAQLLNEIKDRYPDVIRIILSGYADRKLIMDSLGVTHQYLSKPCDAETLKAAVARALSLRSLFKEDPSFQPLISRIHTLPSLPSLYLEIMNELRSPEATISSISQIIARDPAMTAKLLQLVNSAFFGLPQTVSTPEQAVKLLGLDMMRTLVLSTHVFKQCDHQSIQGADLDPLWRHSSIVGIFSKQIAIFEGADAQVSGEAMMAGLLHDIGKLVLLVNLPEDYARLHKLMQREDADLLELEHLSFGATHAEIGAYLLGLWGLPNVIVDAVARHHHPAERLGSGFSPLAAVYVANILANEFAGTGDKAEEIIDWDYLQEHAVRLPKWRDLCRNALERQELP